MSYQITIPTPYELMKSAQDTVYGFLGYPNSDAMAGSQVNGSSVTTSNDSAANKAAPPINMAATTLPAHEQPQARGGIETAQDLRQANAEAKLRDIKAPTQNAPTQPLASNESGSSGSQRSSGYRSLPLEETVKLTPEEVKNLQNDKHTGSRFISSLVAHNQTRQGRQEVKALFSKVADKIHKVQPIAGYHDRNVGAQLKDKEGIKQNGHQSWEPLVNRINDNLKSIKIKHGEAIAKDIGTNFETSHDELFKAKQKEVRVAQIIQLGISSFFVIVGAAVAIAASASTLGAAVPVAPMIGAAISVVGLGLATYITQTAFPALWSNRKTDDEQTANEKAKKIGESIGLQKLPLKKDHINAYTQVLMQSRINKLERVEAAINNELKHFAALWDKVCREDKDWQQIHGDILPAVKQCAAAAARKNPGSNQPTWTLFQQEILDRVDRRLRELQELQAASATINKTLNDDNQKLETELAQDLWSIWLMDKAEFVTGENPRAIPIGKPIAAELVDHKIIADQNKTIPSDFNDLNDTISPMHQFTQEDVILNPGYSVWQLMSRQLRANFTRGDKHPAINLTKTQKEHIARVKRKQAQLIMSTREKFIARTGGAEEDQKNTLKLLNEFEQSAAELRDLKKTNHTEKALKDATKKKDKALLTLIRDRVIMQNFDTRLKSLCPTVYNDIKHLPVTDAQKAALEDAKNKAIEPLEDSSSSEELNNLPELLFA